MARNSIRAFLIDFDGTLVDSEPLHYEAWEAAVRPHGAGVTWEEYQERFVGKTDIWAGETYFREAGLEADPALLEKVRAAKHSYFRREAPERLRIAKETVESILQLSTDLRLMVVTSSKAIDVEPTLQASGLAARFEGRVFGDEVRKHKPDPEPYLLALERLGLAAAECVAFEDSSSGIASAQGAGVEAVRIDSPEMLPTSLRSVFHR